MLDDTLADMKKYAPEKEIVFWKVTWQLSLGKLTYMKADIEGYESRMFRGSVKVLDFYKPATIAFEVLGKSFVFTEV